jgi:hypothetical protein
VERGGGSCRIVFVHCVQQLRVLASSRSYLESTTCRLLCVHMHYRLNATVKGHFAEFGSQVELPPEGGGIFVLVELGEDHRFTIYLGRCRMSLGTCALQGTAVPTHFSHGCLHLCFLV